MIYLSGAVNSHCFRKQHLGLMLTPRMRNRPDLTDTWWGADTGCFTQPQDYSTERYIRWLGSWADYRATCLFATAPDVVGDATATLRAALHVLPLIRQAGFPAALVAQPGLSKDDVPWNDIDCLFIGGPNEWHRSPEVQVLVQSARERGKWVHEGRVNSGARLRAAYDLGCSSADGTFLAYDPIGNVQRMERWFKKLS